MATSVSCDEKNYCNTVAKRKFYQIVARPITRCIDPSVGRQIKAEKSKIKVEETKTLRRECVV